MLYLAGRYLEAADYFGQEDSNDSDALIKKARSLFSGDQPQKALKVLSSVSDKSGLSFQQLYLDCLKLVHPQSKHIPLLDRQVLHLKVENALDKEITDQIEHRVIEPIVHGDRS
jgi:hypothetical protein